MRNRIALAGLIVLGLIGALVVVLLMRNTPNPAPTPEPRPQAADRRANQPAAKRADPSNVSVATVVTAPGETPHFSFPVLWIGPEPTGEISVQLNPPGGAGQALAATLTADTLRCTLPADGEYHCDFAAAGVYADVHKLVVSGGDVRLIHGQAGAAKDKLVLSMGVMVEVEVQCSDPHPEERAVTLYWDPEHWPRTPGRAARHVHEIALGAGIRCLMPVTGARWRVPSDRYYVESPTEPLFMPSADSARLRIKLGRMIPLVVEIHEHTEGAYRQLLQSPRGTPKLVQVSSHANAADGGLPLRQLARNAAFERTPETAASYTGPGVDSFTFLVPPAPVEAEMTAMVRLQGEDVIAIGRAPVSPRDTAIRVTAQIASRNAAVVVDVRDEYGMPMPGVELALSVTHRAHSGGVEHVGAQRMQTTNAEGEARFSELPSSGTLAAVVSVKTALTVVAPPAPVALAEPGEHRVSVVVSTSQRESLLISVTGAQGAAVHAIEGNGSGEWYRQSRLNAAVEPVLVGLGTGTTHVLLIAHAGTAFLSRLVSMSPPPGTVTLDFSQTRPLSISLHPETGAQVFPYPLDSSLAWSALHEPSSWPGIHIPRGQAVEVRVAADLRVLDWPAIAENGALLRLWGAIPAGSEAASVKARSEPVALSTLVVTADTATLKGASDFALLVSPMFFEGPKSAEIEMRFGARIPMAANGAFPAPDLPHGRYVVTLVYKDATGATRFALKPGGHREFFINPGVGTEVRLPLR